MATNTSKFDILGQQNNQNFYVNELSGNDFSLEAKVILLRVAQIYYEVQKIEQNGPVLFEEINQNLFQIKEFLLKLRGDLCRLDLIYSLALQVEDITKKNQALTEELQKNDQ